MTGLRWWRLAVAALAAAVLGVSGCDDDPSKPDESAVCSPDDAFEQNDSLPGASVLQLGNHAAVLCARGTRIDPDYYRFEGKPGRIYRATLNNTASSTGWALTLLDAAHNSVNQLSDGSFMMPAAGSVVLLVQATPAALNAGRNYFLNIDRPNNPPVIAITAEPAAPEVGQTVTFTAGVTDPEGDAIATYTWRYGDGATGSGSTATHQYAQRGTYTVKLIATDEYGAADSATVPLTVSQTVAQVQLTPATLTLNAIGDTARLTAAVHDGGGRTVDATVQWSSSAPAIASVSSTGLVTALTPGAATITADAEGVSDEAAVTVAPEAHSIVVTPTSPTLIIGDSLQLAAAAYDRLGTVVAGVSFQWQSSDTLVAQVTASGMLHARAAGSAEIRAQIGAVQGAVTATVHYPAPATAELLGNGQDGVVGSALAQPIGVRLLDALGRPVGGVQVTFAAQDGSMAPATSTSGADGHATVTWTLDTIAGQQHASASIPGLGDVAFIASAAAGPPATLVIDPDSVHFTALGVTRQLTVAVRDGYGNAIPGATVTWATADTLIARVTASGVIEPVANGSTSITASSGSASSTRPVVVRQVTSTLSLSPTTASVSVGDTTRLHATAYDVSGIAITDAVIAWSTADADIATVAGGLVTGVAEGNTGITATSEGVSKSASIVVLPSSSGALYFAVEGGNMQVGYVNEVLTGEIVIRAYASLYCHSDGCEPTEPVPGVAVMLRAGDGTVDVSPAVTGNDGSAVVHYTLGASSGVDTLRVWIPGAQARVGWSTYQDTAFVRFLATERVDSERFVSVAASSEGGSGHTCALTDADVAWCWGDNNAGQLGIGTFDWDAVNLPVRVAGDLRFTSISTAGWHTCAVATDGTAWCWGDSDQIGSDEPYNVASPTAVTTGERFTKVAAGMWTTCAINTAGKLFCWGDGAYGALGNGTTDWSQTPVAVSSTETFSDVAMGTIFYGCAVATDGDAWCWGANSSGQLGNGVRNTGATTTPVQVVGGHAFTRITAHEDHTCALTTGGTAYCWGYNGDGVLGNGQESVVGVPYWNPEPQLVLGGHSFSDISTGYQHTCAITGTGTLYCWGGNWDGQFGTGSSTPDEYHSPYLSAGGMTFQRVSAGADYTCGLQAGGELYCWGINYAGEVGSGSDASRVYSPERVGGAAPVGQLPGLPLSSVRLEATSAAATPRAAQRDRDAAHAASLQRAAGGPTMR